jgi:TetR/AcrR family transcriptional regulator, regulator of autoinduction and epiphytic fitness
MVDAARELFVGQGYAGTTMDQIASTAGVAVQTVYYTFKTKGQLVIEALEQAAAGNDDPVPASERPWVREMFAASSPQRVLALAVEHGAGVYERVAALWPAINAAAATDPTVAHYWSVVVAARRAGQRAMAMRVAELGGLRTGLDAQRAADLAVVLVGPEVYTGLVHDAGWSVIDYRAWLFTALVHQLLNTDTIDPEAVADLSFAERVSDSVSH